MATLGNNGLPTLADIRASLDPNGQHAAVIEMLNQNNDALHDIPWKEGNLPTGHQGNVRTGIPKSTWRKMYKGTQPTKSTRAQITDTCGILTQRSSVDVDVAELNGNTAAFRLSEADAHIEGMNQDAMETLFYGDTDVTPERFTGLTSRYNTLDTTVPVSANVLSANGSGSDNTSIWLVVWGDKTVHGIYPKGSVAGLSHKDLGEVDALDDEGNPYRALQDEWKWKLGLHLADWRYCVRICNIDVSDLRSLSGTQAFDASSNILDKMIEALATIPNIGKGRAVFYANRTVVTAIPKLGKKNAAGLVTVGPVLDQFGKVVPGFAGANGLSFQGVPIRTVDALLNTEAKVTA